MRGEPQAMTTSQAPGHGHAPHFHLRDDAAQSQQLGTNAAEIAQLLRQISSYRGSEEAEREIAALRQELAASQKHVVELIERVEAVRCREAELSRRLVGLHAEIASRDQRLRQTFIELLEHRNALEQRLLTLRRSLPARIFLVVRKILTLGRK